MLDRSSARSRAADVCVNRRDGRRGLASLHEGDSPTMMKNAAILVVDGNTGALALLVEPLRNAGYRTVGVRSFEAGRRLLHTEWFNLLITDIRLAAYNGLHLVFHSRTLNPACKAIVLAAVPDVSTEIETRRFNAHYVAGPVEPESLLTLVGIVLEEAQTASPEPVQDISSPLAF
jgi:DNA-binding NtrC family response regulator